MQESTDGGKLNRGLAVLNTGFSFLKRPLTKEEFEDLSILGWLTQVFQAAYLIWDDIMDYSEYRRGKPCRYRMADTGLLAINDASLLKSCIFILLQNHSQNHPEYLAFIELFNEAGFRTELGQLCDTTTARNGAAGDMTAEQYTEIQNWRPGIFLPLLFGCRPLLKVKLSDISGGQYLLFLLSAQYSYLGAKLRFMSPQTLTSLQI